MIKILKMFPKPISADGEKRCGLAKSNLSLSRLKFSIRRILMEDSFFFNLNTKNEMTFFVV